MHLAKRFTLTALLSASALASSALAQYTGPTGPFTPKPPAQPAYKSIAEVLKQPVDDAPVVVMDTSPAALPKKNTCFPMAAPKSGSKSTRNTCLQDPSMTNQGCKFEG